MASAVDGLRGLTQQIAGSARRQAAALREVVETTQGAARELAATAAVVRAGRDDVGDARAAVAIAVEQIAGLAATVERLAGHSRAAADAIDQLLASSAQIAAAVAFVDDVAQRTNLLALNASIEAARAGDHGRGFRVVAGEMRTLAESTQSSTAEMTALLAQIDRKARAATAVARGSDEAVALGATASALAEGALASIASAVGSVGDTLARVDETIAAQAARTVQLERASHGVLDIARSHHTAATESTLAVNALAHHAKRLQVGGDPGTARGRHGVLRVATILNDSPSAAAWERFAALVAERTAGRVRVELDIPYTGNGRGEVGAFDDLLGGGLALASVGCSVSGNVIPAAQLFELPYLFDSAEHAFAVLDSPAGRAVLDEAQGVGLLAYGYLENGMRHFTSAQPIRAPEDLRGLRLRVMEAPVYLHFAEALGAIATPVPYFKLPEALRRGEVHAQENPLSNIRGLDLPAVQRYLTLSGHSYTPQIVFAGPAAMAALGDDRTAVEAALAEALRWHRARAREMEREALRWLRARCEVIELDAAARAAFRAAAAAVDERIAHLVGPGRCAALRRAAAALRPSAARTVVV